MAKPQSDSIWPRRSSLLLGLALLLAGATLNPWALGYSDVSGDARDGTLRSKILVLNAVVAALGLLLLVWRPALPKLLRLASIPVTLVLFALGALGLQASWRAARPTQEELDLRRNRAAEELHGHVGGRMRHVAKGAMNLSIPDVNSRKVFAERVLVADLGPLEEGIAKEDEGGVFMKRKWPMAEPVERSADEPVWADLFDRLDYFEYCGFKLVRTDPEAEDRARSDVYFYGLGVNDAGRYVGLKGTLDVTWQREASGEESEWFIDSWITRSLYWLESDDLLFRDVLDQAVPDPALRAELRRSLQDEYAADFLRSSGQQAPIYGFDLVSSAHHPSTQVVDVDDDGWDDIFVTARWNRCWLLRNRGDGTFEDVAEDVGLDFPQNPHTTSALFADFDNDGDRDAFIGSGRRRAVYMENDGGRFADVTEGRVSTLLPFWATSLSAVDYDLDGMLDVYFSTHAGGQVRAEVVQKEWMWRLNPFARGRLLASFLNEEDSKRVFELSAAGDHDLVLKRSGPPNVLLRNSGGGAFEESALSEQVAGWRNTFQSTWADYDTDGDADVYLANDFAPNHLFRNEGGVAFTDVTPEMKTADVGFGMGASWGDYDRDGYQDLYVTNMFSKAGSRITSRIADVSQDLVKAARGNTLFRNRGADFEQVSGQKAPALLVEKGGWGWSGQFLDVDNDGYLDIHALSGYYTAPKEFQTPEDT